MYVGHKMVLSALLRAALHDKISPLKGSTGTVAWPHSAPPQVQPIMKKRNWICPLLTEFYPANECLLGLNIGGGGGRTREIKVCGQGHTMRHIWSSRQISPCHVNAHCISAILPCPVPGRRISNICPCPVHQEHLPCSVHQDHPPLSHACSSHL